MIIEDSKSIAIKNTNFRKVLYTGKNSQLVMMSIPVNGEIGEEVHPNTDQIFFFVSGKVEAMLNNETRELGEGDVVFVPAGTTHNFKNIGDKDVKLFTVYSPPEHPDGTIHKTKADAEKDER